MRRIKIKEGGYKDGFTKDFRLLPKIGSYAQIARKSFREPVLLRVSGEISLPSIILV
jgi:hypothetical protein